MNYLMRSLIAVPIFASLTVSGGASIAAIPSTPRIASADTTLSSAGFLDFKSLLFSSGPGDNLDGVSDQIRIIGPDMFQNALLRHDGLQIFKSRRRPVWSTSPVWGANESDLDVLQLDVYGKPSAASAEQVDAILGDISDNTRNHGVSWMQNPTIGAGTVTYFNTASKKVIDLLEKLEMAALAVPGIPGGAPAPSPVIKISPLLLVFLFGLVLVTIGLLRRRSRRNSRRPIRRADPAACFEAIGKSPIQYATKTP